MKGKYIIVIIAAAVFMLALVGGVGYFIYQKTAVSPAKAFEKLQTNSLAQATSYMHEPRFPSSDTISQTVQGSLDLNAKSLEAYGELTCKVNSSSGNFTTKFGVYAKNATSNLSFLSVSGKATVDGQELDLGQSFQPIVGKWFSIPDEDKAIAQQLSNQVMFNDVSVYAPKADQKQVYDSLVKNNVFTVSNGKKSTQGSRDVYTYTVTVTKNSYLKFLNESFPSMGEKDLILDNIFSNEKDSMIIELTVDAKTFAEVSKVSRAENMCATYLEGLIGVTDNSLSSEVGIKSEAVQSSDIKITAPTNVQSIDTMTQLLTQ